MSNLPCLFVILCILPYYFLLLYPAASVMAAYCELYISA